MIHLTTRRSVMVGALGLVASLVLEAGSARATDVVALVKAFNPELTSVMSASQMSQLGYAGGSKSGSPYDGLDDMLNRTDYRGVLECPRGQVLVGLEGYAGSSIIHRLSGLCVRVNSSGRWLDPQGNYAYGNGVLDLDAILDATARRNYYWGAGSWSPFEGPGVLETTSLLSRGAWMTLRGFGQRGKGTHFRTVCPGDHAMTGFSGRAGWSLSRLQLRCKRLNSSRGADGAEIALASVGATSGGSGFSARRCSGTRVARRIKLAFRHEVSPGWEPEAELTWPTKLKLYCGYNDVAPGLLDAGFETLATDDNGLVSSGWVHFAVALPGGALPGILVRTLGPWACAAGTCGHTEGFRWVELSYAQRQGWEPVELHVANMDRRALTGVHAVSKVGDVYVVSGSVTNEPYPYDLIDGSVTRSVFRLPERERPDRQF